MPAIRATLSTSPFLRLLVRIRGRAVGLEKVRVQVAMAVREVMALGVIETMWAVPVGVRWVSIGVGGLDFGLVGGDFVLVV